MKDEKMNTLLFRFVILFSVFIYAGQLTVWSKENQTEIVQLKKPCRIEVREQGSQLPVPLVEFRTTHQQRFVTDNAGVIALDSPELMGRETWFDVIGYGYSVKKDGFAMSGVRLIPEYGKTLCVEVQRDIVAKRLGRLTGAGLAAESQKLGSYLQLSETGVFGCDSVQTAVYNGRLFWIWGDTTLAHYPLGIFHATAATTKIDPFSTLELPVLLSYKYFTDSNKKLRGVAVMPGEGPTWLSGCVALPDKNGTERLVAVYAKIKPPLEVYEYGLCVWDDIKKSFEHLRTVWRKKQNYSQDLSDSSLVKPFVPEGHALLWTDKQGKRWVMFGNPFPILRCPATYEAWQNPDQWEQLIPLETLVDAEKNLAVEPHSGSIVWSEFRKCWIAVFVQKFGKPAAFGEVWYAESCGSDPAAKKWGKAVKILSHGNYTFYNPYLHPESLASNCKVLFFEGTFSAMFADKPDIVPRYDYTQILYQIDLDNPALAPAQKK
ncbi:MAG: hypothetical protein LBE18_04705 [Planctomycetaceae bacterium]|nr:hypothetical protein [Planctomycetaceae bacterium]